MGSFLCVRSIPVVYTALTTSSTTTDRVPRQRFNEYCNVNSAAGAGKVQQLRAQKPRGWAKVPSPQHVASTSDSVSKPNKE